MSRIKGGNKNSLFSQWKKVILVISFFALFLTPIQVFAQEESTPTNTPSPTEIKIEVPDIGPTDINVVWNNIWNLLFGLAGIVAVIFIIYAGYMYITSGGNTDQMNKAKMQIIAAVIGLIIIIASVAIVQFVDKALQGNLQLFSGNLSSRSQNSSSSTSQSSSSSSTDSPAARPASSTDTTKIETNDQETKTKIQYCKNYEEQAKACYEEAAVFLAGTDYCKDANKNALSQEAQKACDTLINFRDTLYDSLGSIEQKIDNQTITATDAFVTCYNSYGTTKVILTCDNKNLQRTITNDDSATPSPETIPAKNITPYQQCTQDAENTYKSCQNQSNQICYTQQKAYEPCLGGIVGFLNNIFSWKLCPKLKKAYYDCKNNWQKTCSTRRSQSLELCRIRYQ
ncbi:MAG: pilin [Patescibacteria group bacterium]|nr:pilin [Patescibacteria group bacterium]